MATTLPSEAGWYPDPYASEMVRYFDGSQWTTHAVSASTPHPNAVVEAHHDPRTSEEIRRQERLAEHPSWDLAIAREGEPAFDGRGGVGGLYANRIARASWRNPRLLIVLIVVFLCAGCIALVSTSGSSSTTEQGRTTVHTFVFTVTGSGTSTAQIIIFGVGAGDRLSNVSLPWTRTFRLTAQDLGPAGLRVRDGPTASSSVTCTITEGATVIDSETASGPHSVALCEQAS